MSARTGARARTAQVRSRARTRPRKWSLMDQQPQGSLLISPPRPSIYLLLDPKCPLFGTIYPYLRVQGGSWLTIILKPVDRSFHSGYGLSEIGTRISNLNSKILFLNAGSGSAGFENAYTILVKHTNSYSIFTK